MNRIVHVVTPSGPLALLRPTAEKLLKEGVISGTLDGGLHAADAATVKAAVMASAICDFCSTPGATHHYDVPDFGITKNDDPNNYGAAKSTGGWMACDACAALIDADKRKQLIDRAVATMAFPKFTRRAIEELYEKFWQGMDERAQAAGTAAAFYEFIADLLKVPDVRIETSRDKRIRAVMDATGLTRAQVDAIPSGQLDADAVKKLAAFNRRFDAKSRRQIVDIVLGPHKPLPDLVPHWQRALDAKFEAMTTLASMLGKARSQMVIKLSTDDPGGVERAFENAQRSLTAKTAFEDMGFTEDVKFLRTAQAYSFNGETTAAIREAARSIPHDAPLSSIETPNVGSGWFWFSEPLDVEASSAASAKTQALLWGWTEGPTGFVTVDFDDEMLQHATPEQRTRIEALAKRSMSTDYIYDSEAMKNLASEMKPLGITQEMLDRHTRKQMKAAIMFSAYVVDETNGPLRGKVLPSTRWYWPLEMSFHDMIAFNTGQHRASYGPGGKYEGDANVMGEEKTMACIAELSLFFVMACLWFRQTVPASSPILTREPGHVERHARKRYVREHKLTEPPSVQVVALRASAKSEKPQGEKMGSTREYHCRWIVQGHPRLQRCGPGRKDQKLIWIDAHPAGPTDKPLRTRQKVYAVIR